MLKIVEDNTRIQFKDGYDLYPDQHVLLGYTKDYENISGVESGIVLAVAERSDRHEIWKLFSDYLLTGKHKDLLLHYFGEVNASGVYI